MDIYGPSVKPIPTVLLVAATLALGSSGTSAPDQVHAGRWQIIAATVLIADRPEPTVFRIDTSTGQCDRFQFLDNVAQSAAGIKVSAEGWTPVQDIFSAIKDAQTLSPRTSPKP